MDSVDSGGDSSSDRAPWRSMLVRCSPQSKMVTAPCLTPLTLTSTPSRAQSNLKVGVRACVWYLYSSLSRSTKGNRTRWAQQISWSCLTDRRRME